MIDYKEIRQHRNDAGSFIHQLGARIDFLEEGHSEASMVVDKSYENQIGSIHGGVLYSLADTTCGAVNASYGYKGCTANSTFYYMNPGLHTTKLFADARAIKHGHRSNVIEVKIYDQNQELLCQGIFTFMNLDEKLPYAWKETN